jgi:hypothetical protein
MKHRAALLSLSLVAGCVAADQGDGLKVALAAKPTINLGVYLDPVLSQSLTMEQVRMDAELILRQNHISVAKKNEGDAGLFISLKATPLTLSRATLYAVLPAIEYIEQVTPGAAIVKCAIDNRDSLRDAVGCTDHHTVAAALWRKDSVMQIGGEQLPRLRERMKDLVTEFALEYLRANESK